MSPRPFLKPASASVLCGLIVTIISLCFVSYFTQDFFPVYNWGFTYLQGIRKSTSGTIIISIPQKFWQPLVKATSDLHRDEIASSSAASSSSSESIPRWGVIVISVLCSFVGFVALITAIYFGRRLLLKAGQHLAHGCHVFGKFILKIVVACGYGLKRGLRSCWSSCWAATNYVLCCKCVWSYIDKRKKPEVSLTEIPQNQTNVSGNVYALPPGEIPTPPASTIPPSSPDHTMAPLPDRDPNPLPGTTYDTQATSQQVPRPTSSNVITRQFPYTVDSREALSQIHSHLWPKIHENVTGQGLVQQSVLDATPNTTSIVQGINTQQLQQQQQPSAVDWILQLPNALMSTYSTYPAPAAAASNSNSGFRGQNSSGNNVYEDTRVRRLVDRPVTVMDLPLTGFKTSGV